MERSLAPHSSRSATSDKEPSRAELLAREKHKTLPPELDGKSLSGRVSEIFDEKQFGFIAAAGLDFFFHASAADDFDDLRPGDRVGFVAIPGKGGLPRAVSVRKEDSE